MEKEKQKPISSYQRLNTKYKNQIADTELVKEAFEYLGGFDALQEKIENAKKEKQASSTNLFSKVKQKFKNEAAQKVHDSTAKKTAKLLKQEYKLAEKGHTFDRTSSLEVRKNNINAAIEIEKMNATIDRKVKWEKQVNTVKSVSKAVTKTAEELTVNPVKKVVIESGKTFNQEVVVPTTISVKVMKENINQDITKTKDKVTGVVNKTKALKQRVSKSIKASVIKHSSLTKNQATVEDKLGFVAARASMNVSSRLAKGFQNKFSNALSKVSSKVKDSLSKTKSTFNKHLEVEKSKTVSNTKSKDNGMEM
ncbi:hypothetical protein U8V72_19920 [Priestia filamentosa]|uniref:hypothetical protein n=1 Tax=Priestia filamentosa TaxID=1402861 RepID=UPI00397CB085